LGAVDGPVEAEVPGGEQPLAFLLRRRGSHSRDRELQVRRNPGAAYRHEDSSAWRGQRATTWVAAGACAAPGLPAGGAPAGAWLPGGAAGGGRPPAARPAEVAAAGWGAPRRTAPRAAAPPAPGAPRSAGGAAPTPPAR